MLGLGVRSLLLQHLWQRNNLHSFQRRHWSLSLAFRLGRRYFQRTTSFSTMAAKVPKESKLNLKGGNPVVCIISSYLHVVDVVPVLTDACPSATFVEIDYKDISLKSLQEAEIIIADPHLVAPWAFQLPKLKWVQSTYAGVEDVFKYLPQDKLYQPSFVLTRLGGVFGPIMAEYVIGHIIAREKKFKLLWQCQKTKEWVPERDIKCRLLSDISIGIIGFGDIGREIAKYCKSMKMTVNSVQRQVSSSKLPFVDNAFSVQDLSECLKQCDYFCNILPSSPATHRLLSGNVLESCKEKKTVFINIGRADVIDNDSLLNALNNQWIGGAILDVFEEEPLPSNSPLWDHPQITITPHCSGFSWGDKIVKRFLENFPKYKSGKPMEYTVDLRKGY